MPSPEFESEFLPKSSMWSNCQCLYCCRSNEIADADYVRKGKNPLDLLDITYEPRTRPTKICRIINTYWLGHLTKKTFPGVFVPQHNWSKEVLTEYED